MEKAKENVLNDFVNMIEQSWTWEKMTKEEQTKLIETLYHNRTLSILKGAYKQRWEILQSIYYAFLCGLGYDGFTWRDDDNYLPF